MDVSGLRAPFVAAVGPLSVETRRVVEEPLVAEPAAEGGRPLTVAVAVDVERTRLLDAEDEGAGTVDGLLTRVEDDSGCVFGGWPVADTEARDVCVARVVVVEAGVRVDALVDEARDERTGARVGAEVVELGVLRSGTLFPVPVVALGFFRPVGLAVGSEEAGAAVAAMSAVGEQRHESQRDETSCMTRAALPPSAAVRTAARQTRRDHALCSARSCSFSARWTISSALVGISVASPDDAAASVGGGAGVATSCILDEPT